MSQLTVLSLVHIVFGYTNQRCRWHRAESLVIEQVSCHLTHGSLTGKDPRSESLRAERPLITSWIVRCKLFFIDRFENSYHTLILAAKNISSTGTILSQLWDKAFLESRFNLRVAVVEYILNRSSLRKRYFINSLFFFLTSC